MRSEKEMLDLILGYASGNEDVRAVVMNGSRVNPNAPKDRFQDYDIVYFVRDLKPYIRNRDLPRFFGEIMILQTPDDMDDGSPKREDGYGYLMQFTDGNRIDLGFFSLEAISRCREDSLTLVLLDKDGRIDKLPPPSDQDYWPQKPTKKAFEDSCTEFWWLNPYVAKGLWRNELTYARYMLDDLMRAELMKMLTWYAGMQTAFHQSVGKQGKYLKHILAPDLWALLERTFSDADLEHTWEALFSMGDLFRRAAIPVAEQFGFEYPEREDAAVSAYIRRIRQLPSGSLTSEIDS